MRKICPTTAFKQALPIFEELVKAGSPWVKTRRRSWSIAWRSAPRSRPGHSAREASVSAPAHLPEREEEGERAAGEQAGEAGAGVNHFLAAKGRRAVRRGFHEEQGRSAAATRARVCPKQNCWRRQVPGKGCAWMVTSVALLAEAMEPFMAAVVL